MTAQNRRIMPADVLPHADYAAKRTELRRSLIPVKKKRRIEVGPFATFYFESYDTMWLQVQEMLHIEKGGAEQIDDEIRRSNVLKRLAGIEDSIAFDVDGIRIKGAPTDYEDRTTPDGKTSSVHWIRFVFTPEQQKAFAKPEARVLLAVEHPNYGHIAVVPADVRTELAKDFG
jgi:hypothetical protein